MKRQNCAQKHEGKCIDVIFGIKAGKSEIQALRYPKLEWTEAAARAHCQDRKGSFEPASGKGLEPDEEILSDSRPSDMYTSAGMANQGEDPQEDRMRSSPDRQRAYSVLNLKSVDEEKRIIEGIATTPTPDRMADIVEPDGLQFNLPFPFLYQHNSRQPIGNVVAAKISKDGMKITAKLAPAGTAGFIDEAWNLIKAGLVRGLSIGFRSLEESYDKVTGGFRFLRTELLEISAVTIPANAEANITAVKSFALAQAAAPGTVPARTVRLDTSKKPAGAPEFKQGQKVKTIAEQIAGFEAKRQASAARMTEIMNKAGEEGRTLDAQETEEYDGLAADVKSVDEHLVRLRAHESQLVSTATEIKASAVETPAAAGRTRSGIVTVKGPDLPKGTAFVRYALALAASVVDRNKRSPYEIAQSQKHWKDQTPEVEICLKAAASDADTTTSGWASQLAPYTWMASEFIEFLRPMTIIGRLPGLRRVPFNISVPLQSAGSSGHWVGEGAQKPVSAGTFDTTQLRFAKAAGICVLTDELVRFSNPSAEAIIRQDLAAAIVQFLDEQFINPTVAVNGNVSPASITNGAGHAAATGVDAEDFRDDWKLALLQMLAANIPPNGCAFIMQPYLAVALSLMRNALGQREFPDITADGGTLEGYAVVTSNSVRSGDLVFLKPAEVMLADDGEVTLDASREASIVMDDGTSPAVTTTISLWQTNRIALRAERTINWKRRRDAAVYYITGCDYGGTASP